MDELFFFRFSEFVFPFVSVLRSGCDVECEIFIGLVGIELPKIITFVVLLLVPAHHSFSDDLILLGIIAILYGLLIGLTHKWIFSHLSLTPIKIPNETIFSC